MPKHFFKNSCLFFIISMSVLIHLKTPTRFLNTTITGINLAFVVINLLIRPIKDEKMLKFACNFFFFLVLKTGAFRY